MCHKTVDFGPVYAQNWPIAGAYKVGEVQGGRDAGLSRVDAGGVSSSVEVARVTLNRFIESQRPRR